eukprot:TRINITY_DN32018_c0_g1_i1.p1 TRINITY_DN32018_c0_g1~~TRINITY_DN32018_c0_g1_i1.p1  ORF type:complete len:373 (-),score=105.45 TRINITY_DN32018_c0_g1_i1:180-1298(-)
MAPLNLKIKVTAADSFEVEVDDSETVEALGVVVFSLRPDLGESVRIIHKAKVLKDDQTLSACGMQNGDNVAVARKTPAAAPATPTVEATAPATADASSRPSVSTPDVPTTAEPVPEAKATEEQSAEAKPEGQTAEEMQPEKKQRTEEKPVDEPMPASSADAPTDAPPSPQPGMTRQGSADSQASLQEDYSSADGLRSLARRLDADGSAIAPEHTAHALRAAAEKIQSLEGVVRDSLQALHMMNIVSGTALQRALGEGGEGGSLASALAAKQDPEEHRSFLMKKGDAATQELHAAASAVRPSMSGGTAGGGTLSSKPTSREEMEQARKARLARLEADQASKKKAMEEAEEKSKSREAMFNRPNVGPAKQLGKH